MRPEAYDSLDAYDAYDSDSYDAYNERWRPPPGVRRRPGNYTAPIAANSKPTEFVTRSELQLALAPVSRDIAAQGEAVTTLGKRVESALVKIDKDTTAARRDAVASKQGLQGTQMMALLPLLLSNNTPPQLVESRTSARVAWQNPDGSIVSIPTGDAIASTGKLPPGAPILVDDDNHPLKVVTDVQYGAAAAQGGLAGGNSLLLIMMMMMMGGGFGGSSDGKEGGYGGNNMMMMVLMLTLLKPQTTTTPTTQVVGN